VFTISTLCHVLDGGLGTAAAGVLDLRARARQIRCAYCSSNIYSRAAPAAMAAATAPRVRAQSCWRTFARCSCVSHALGGRWPESIILLLLSRLPQGLP
jgi:hypothetical protein